MEYSKGTSRRIEYLDIAKGIAIIFVLIGHTVPEGQIKNIIYSFHMPLFFFVSGYFFKQRSGGELWRQQLKRSMLPYAVTSIVIILGCTARKLIAQGLPAAGSEAGKWSFAALYGSGLDMDVNFHVPQIGAIWFLPALMTGYLIVNLACRYRFGAVIVLVSAVVGAVSVRYVWLPMSIQPGMVSAVFLYGGHKLRPYLDNEYLKKIPVIIAGALIWFAGALFGGRMVMATNEYETGVLNFITAFLGIYVMIAASMIIEAHFERIKSALMFFGQNTLIILCVHITELNVFPWTRFKALLRNDLGIRYRITVGIVICIRLAVAVCAVLIYKRIKNSRGRHTQCPDHRQEHNKGI